MEKIKTHWLQNPNKNYLWHQDLPNGDDLIVTIKSAQWEDVKDPTRWTTESKRVVRFAEPKIKPFICNETNAESIMKATNTKFMEDVIGKQIQLFISQTKVKREMVDCLRIKQIAPKFNNAQDLEKIRKCTTIEQLQKTFLALSHLAKADKAIINLTNELKIKLWK